MMMNDFFQGNNPFNPMNQMPNQNIPTGYGYQQPVQSTNKPFLPGRIVFSPEQIAPQEIPTNGMPALFPLNDGSKIIVKSMLGNGLFNESVYVLQSQNPQNQASEFDQVMMRLGGIENSLNQVLNDLYGTKSQGNQEGDTNKNE